MHVCFYLLNGFTEKQICRVQEVERGIERRRVRGAQGVEEMRVLRFFLQEMTPGVYNKQKGQSILCNASACKKRGKRAPSECFFVITLIEVLNDNACIRRKR